MALTEAQQEAAELADAIIRFAQGRGWGIERRGVNKTYAWVRLTHPWHHPLQAFYAVDEEKNEDKFIYGSVVVPLEILKTIIMSGSTADLADVLVAPELTHTQAETLRACAALGTPVVPPTDAAHSAAHPPMPPTMPPTVDEAQSAAHTRAVNAAHATSVVPPIVPPTGTYYADAAHREQAEKDLDWLMTEAKIDRQEEELPGMWEPSDLQGGLADSADEFGHEEGIWIGQEAERHLKQAGQPACQQDTIAAVIAQQKMGARRNCSNVASPLRNEELIALVLGKTITFRNRVSGRLEQATVATKADTKRYPPKITPLNFDVESENEDMRILHFLELGAGFRSVAVSQITEIS